MTAIVSVYVVFASAEEAGRIGRAMIEQRLAACVNILGPCHSVYRWQGAIGTAQEVPAIFKTTAGQAEALVAALADAHSYDVPAICVWPVEGAPEAYTSWVRQETEGQR